MEDNIKTKIGSWYAQRRIDKHLLKGGLPVENLEVTLYPLLETYDDFLIGYLYKCLTKESVEAQYPRDWWEHVKERFMPKFMVKRFPVKYRKVVALHKFPHLGKEYVELQNR